MEWFLYTLITDVSAVQIWNGSYTLQSLMCQKHKYGMVPIHTNHWCVRSTTMEWFLYTSISDVSEAQVWNGSYTHKSLMCTIMEWFLYTTTLTCQKHNYGMVPIYTNHWCAQLCNGSYTHTPITGVHNYAMVPIHTHQSLLLEAQLERQSLSDTTQDRSSVNSRHY